MRNPHSPQEDSPPPHAREAPCQHDLHPQAPPRSRPRGCAACAPLVSCNRPVAWSCGGGEPVGTRQYAGQSIQCHQT